MTFGARIKLMRKRGRLSTAAFAKKLNISENYLFRIEQGSRIPSFELVVQISKILKDIQLTSQDPDLSLTKLIESWLTDNSLKSINSSTLSIPCPVPSTGDTYNILAEYLLQEVLKDL